AAFFAACLLAAGTASAQTYPSRSVTLLVPYPPGGATDTIARILQNPMQNALGQTIVIENVGGAGGVIAASRTARAGADGYTILIHQVALAAGMSLYKNMNFDAAKDFATIGLINTAASTLAAPASLPPNNFKELLAWAKTPGHVVRIGHAGVGSYSHLAGVLVAQELGYKKLNIDFWHMLLAPAGTPRPIIDKLNAALRAALNDPNVKKTFNDGGMDEFDPAEETPEAADTLLKSEIKLWGDVIRANQISAQ